MYVKFSPVTSGPNDHSNDCHADLHVYKNFSSSFSVLYNVANTSSFVYYITPELNPASFILRSDLNSCFTFVNLLRTRKCFIHTTTTLLIYISFYLSRFCIYLTYAVPTSKVLLVCVSKYSTLMFKSRKATIWQKSKIK